VIAEFLFYQFLPVAAIRVTSPVTQEVAGSSPAADVAISVAQWKSALPESNLFPGRTLS